MRWFVFFVLLAIGAQCFEGQASAPAPGKEDEVARTDAVTKPAQASEEDAIREALFRYLESNNPYIGRTDIQQLRGIKDYCLAVGYNLERTEPHDPSDLLSGLLIDPSDTFMERFSDEDALSHKASTCREGLRGGVRDKRTDRPCILLVITKITFVSEKESRAEAEYNRAPLDAEGLTYTLKNENGKWKVLDTVRRWIS